ncbi:MAG: ubiquitin-like small modifier protein 1 [Actinomycetota bacterium]
MSVRVKIPTQLRQLAGGASELNVDAAPTVRDLIEKVGSEHPGLKERLLDEEGQIRRFINVYVGDEDVRFMQGMDTPVEDATTVSILPAVAGGCA